MMFGRTFAPCSGEQTQLFGPPFGGLFFTGARAARSRSRNPKNKTLYAELDHSRNVSQRASSLWTTR